MKPESPRDFYQEGPKTRESSKLFPIGAAVTMLGIAGTATAIFTTLHEDMKDISNLALSGGFGLGVVGISMIVAGLILDSIRSRQSVAGVEPNRLRVSIEHGTTIIEGVDYQVIE